MILWSFIVVFSGYVSLIHHGVDAFHVVNPFYINLYDDDMTSENFESKLLSNSSSLVPIATTKFQSKETVLKSDVSATPGDLKSSWSSTNTDSDGVTILQSKETTLPTDDKRKASQLFEQNDILDLELRKSELVTPSEKPVIEKYAAAVVSDISMPESSDDISMQFTRIYLKAITSLIQHIMDALFSVNDSVSEKRLSETTKYDYNHALSPSRKLIKREISNIESKPDANSIATSIGDETTQPSADKASGADKGIVSETKSSLKDADNSDGGTSPSSQEEPAVLTSSSNPVYKTDLPNLHEKLNENKKQENSVKLNPYDEPESILHVKDNKIAIKDHNHISDYPHVAFISDANDISQMKGRLLEKKDTKHTLHDYMLSVDGLHDQDSDLMSYKKTNEDSADFEGKNKFGQQPSEGAQKESSASGTILITSGVVMIVIILASAGAAVAYTLRKRSFNQSGNQHASAQRPIVA